MKRVPTSHDIAVGERIREARAAADMTQQELASEMGVSYQQLQKYENGSNRIPGARISLLVTLLHKPLEYFFPDITDVIDPSDSQHLARKFSRIASAKARRAVHDLVDVLLEEQGQ